MGGFLDFWISAARYTPQQIVQMQLTVAFYRYCLAVKAPVSVLLSMHQSLFQRLKSVLLDLTAAIAFYTCLPVPIHWTLNFQRVACWVPVVGLLIGGLLGLLD
ncbi:MAG TPA: adenosylcobinamide-GDP ribazoletransferase, partial [Allocoleopsis sp.]